MLGSQEPVGEQDLVDTVKSPYRSCPSHGYQLSGDTVYVSHPDETGVWPPWTLAGDA
jgi:hypothetical protein